MDWQKLSDKCLRSVVSSLGRTVAYEHTTGEVSSLKGISAREFVEISNQGSKTAVLANRQTLCVRIADLAKKPAKGDQVTIDAVIFVVIETREDGEGGSTLVLQRK